MIGNIKFKKTKIDMFNMTFVSILNNPPMTQLEFKRVKHDKSFKVVPINF